LTWLAAILSSAHLSFPTLTLQILFSSDCLTTLSPNYNASRTSPLALSQEPLVLHRHNHCWIASIGSLSSGGSSKKLHKWLTSATTDTPPPICVIWCLPIVLAIPSVPVTIFCSLYLVLSWSVMVRGAFPLLPLPCGTLYLLISASCPVLSPSPLLLKPFCLTLLP